MRRARGGGHYTVRLYRSYNSSAVFLAVVGRALPAMSRNVTHGGQSPPYNVNDARPTLYFTLAVPNFFDDASN